MTDHDRLRQVIAATGLPDCRFAVEVLMRDERTVRRWLAGDGIPECVSAKLRSRPLATWRRLAEIVASA